MKKQVESGQKEENLDISQKSEPNKILPRMFTCECGKAYLTYGACYTHIKIKHKQKSQEYLKKLKKPSSGSSKRGRPKKYYTTDKAIVTNSSIFFKKDLIYCVTNLEVPYWQTQMQKLPQFKQANNTKKLKKKYGNIPCHQEQKHQKHIKEFCSFFQKHLQPKQAAKLKYNLKTFFSRQKAGQILASLSNQKSFNFQATQTDKYIVDLYQKWKAQPSE